MKIQYKKFDVLKKFDVFLITYCKRFHPKSPFYEKVKMTTKRTIVLESFVTLAHLIVITPVCHNDHINNR